MPRTVDHEERRREIIEALWRVTAAKGLPAVSFREVAAEAGVSVRRVQYYFGTKAQLLLASIQMLGERVVARGMAGIADAGPNPSSRALMRAVVRGALPMDDESRRDSLLFLTFYLAALADETLASSDTLQSTRGTVLGLVDVLHRGKERGELRAGVDPTLDAQLIVAANTGLIVSVLAGLQTGDEAMATMDHHLDRIFKARSR